MRPIASEQDPITYPLNELIGTRAHVKLLRIRGIAKFKNVFLDLTNDCDLKGCCRS
jgi:hypothetical protein